MDMTEFFAGIMVAAGDHKRNWVVSKTMPPTEEDICNAMRRAAKAANIVFGFIVADEEAAAKYLDPVASIVMAVMHLETDGAFRRETFRAGLKAAYWAVNAAEKKK